MAHECPFCGATCYCDGDDTFGLPVPDSCAHFQVCPEFVGEEDLTFMREDLPYPLNAEDPEELEEGDAL